MTSNCDPRNQPEAVHQKVCQAYGQIARQGNPEDNSGSSCCGSSTADSERLAQHVGYSAEELAALPDGANLGFSGGIPNALAAVVQGELVLDRGSGAGFAFFIAGRKVGAPGRAIGVDMTAD